MVLEACQEHTAARSIASGTSEQQLFAVCSSQASARQRLLQVVERGAQEAMRLLNS